MACNLTVAPPFLQIFKVCNLLLHCVFRMDFKQILNLTTTFHYGGNNLTRVPFANGFKNETFPLFKDGYVQISKRPFEANQKDISGIRSA